MLIIIDLALSREVKEAFRDYWEGFVQSLPRFTIAVVVLAAAIFLSAQIVKIVQLQLRRKSRDPLLIPFISRTMRWIMILGGLMLALQIMGFNNLAGSLIAGAGISAFVVGFALKDIGENFLAGAILAFNRPFHVGDIINVDKHTGTVRALHIRTTHVRTFDGNDVYIPNAIMIKNTLVNITATGLTRVDFLVNISYSDNIDKAFELIIVAIKDIEGVIKEKPPFVNVDSFSLAGINLRVYFWYNSITFEKGIFFLQSQVMKCTIEALARNGFKLPGTPGYGNVLPIVEQPE